MRVIKTAIVVLLVACSISCKPRGETKTLDEVVALARERYQQSYQQAGSQLSSDVSGVVSKIQITLDAIDTDRQGAKLSENAKLVEEHLMSLQSRVGYTTRPSLAELIKQYRVMATNQHSSAKKTDMRTTVAAARLLASRTYHLMASELETTHFALS